MGIDLTKDSYIDKKGRTVFTKRYHIKRGYCCGNKCLHCPYENEAPSAKWPLE
mgnify:FL=1|tara:strand:- start:150 stop:308 length:159 start_codon:yes stop_codon:yes gene_type:complete